jgi:hypothetical protein
MVVSVEELAELSRGFEKIVEVSISIYYSTELDQFKELYYVETAIRTSNSS